ncbi:uncharacterized protein TRUGW13939_04027 [Talaromyces rugulosus]|uniref:Major facilitator superfamily (MFS) profile domain-containing protein n=1 Tax=Talaromyces rugulosus TaxID=121627 RepID=A0A7H8QSN6_TALRU|nr:uncharacterized protein TRUGW13939_04027 [Talaromyces rugulosus]QKX56919.1 hypothetical protein TRUGW13939_04027 [Talaromyces rugulosus]
MAALSLTRSIEATHPVDELDYQITEKIEPTPATSRASSDETRQSPEDVEKNGVETVDGEGDSNMVWWDGDNDPANPMNWSTAKKWTNVGIVSAITFIVPLASSMFAPGVSQVSAEFGTTNELLQSLVVSIYVLGLALGPLVLAPLSEVYGRWVCYACSNVFYTVFTVACAVSTNMSMLIVFRFLAGCMGSAPLAVGGGTIADLFPVSQRGKALSLYTLGPVCGPAIGPIAGGFLSEAKGWRWIFWVLTIASGAVTIGQMIFASETFAIGILDKKTKRLQKETGNMDLRSKLDRGISSTEILKRAIIRPTKLSLFSPICILLSLASVLVYGILYLILTTFPLVFESTYGFSSGISGLAYIGLGVGNVLGLLVFTFTSDKYIQKRAAQGLLQPEDRLPLLLVSTIVSGTGLFWYGWSAKAHTHWIVPIIGSSLVGVGNMFFFMPVLGYLVDSFTVYAASAMAANTVLRSIGGALLPLAGPKMYASLGYGWGNSVLGFLAIAFTPALYVIYRHGKYIRTRWPVNLG